MSWTDDTGPVPNRTEAEFLSLVRQKADAAAGRRRWQAGLATAALLLIGVLVTVVTRSGPDSGTELRTVSGGLSASTSTTSPSPPVTTGDAIVPMPHATTTTAGGAPTITSTLAPPRVAPPASSPTTSLTTAVPATTVPPPTSTSLACRNSSNPVCGPHYWDPAPGPNQPMTVAISVSPSSPKAGETVTFRVTVDDPDGSHLLSRTDGTVDYGDGTPTMGVGGHVDCIGGSGPWTPPPPVPVHEELTYQHVYVSAGTYTATFTYRSMGNCAYGPSEAVRPVTVTVLPPA